jgi:peptidyl-tRNA hydrolase, PTH1 family
MTEPLGSTIGIIAIYENVLLRGRKSILSLKSGIQLIIGLGNPGPEYEHTRHNAGAWFVAELVEKAHALLRRETQFLGWHCLAHLDHYDCHLLVPTTYMNHSGLSVKTVSRFYKIEPAAILIAHDEIDLPVGEVRLKYDGGHGGHNGLRDIIQHLNTNKFYRLRIGVGRPNNKEVVDYVLKPPKRAEREQINAGIERVYDILPLIFAGEFQKAMHQLHTDNT